MGRGKSRNTMRKKSIKNEIQASGSSHCMVLLPLTKIDKIRGGNCGRGVGKKTRVWFLMLILSVLMHP